MKFETNFNHSQFQKYVDFLKANNTSSATIDRKLSSLNSFQTFLVKRGHLKKTTFDSKIVINRTKNSIFKPFINKYLIFGTLISIVLGLVYGLYTQAILKAKQELAYSTSTSLTRPGRILSFQGRLTDSVGNAILVPTNIVFKFYNSSVGGTELYTSSVGNSQTINPDDNGIFNVVIGKTHGTEIPASVFSENAEIWLEIIADDEIMDPRQQIATVAYALNSETLQGIPPSASGLKDTVLVIDNLGNLNLGETSPTIKSISGTMAIEGQALLLKASDGSGGNITINPDGNGVIRFITEGTSPNLGGFIDISNANIVDGNLLNAQINNDNRGYNFLSFRNYSIGTTNVLDVFSVGASGNVYISESISMGTTTLSNNLNADLLDGFHQDYFLNIGQTGNFITTLNNGVGISISGSGIGRTISVDYDSANLKLTGNKLTTIQDINTTAAPTFASLGLGATSSDYLLNVLGNGYFSTALTVGTSASIGSHLTVGGDITATGTIRKVTVNAVSNTAIGTAAKVATVATPGYTLTAGDLLSVTFTYGNSVNTATLNIDGTARNIRLGNSNVTTVNFTLAAGATVLMYFDGTYFQIMGSQRLSDSDATPDRIYWGNAITAGTTINRYKLLMQSSDGNWYPLTLDSGTGTTKVVSTVEFLPDSPILYYNTTTTVNTGTSFTNVYSEIPMTTLSYTANSGSWTNQQPIYLKGTINSNGKFVLDNSSYTSFLTQTLPTSDDGFVYVLLGQMYSTTAMRLFQYHPMYKYSFGRVQPYSPNDEFFVLRSGDTISGDFSIEGNFLSVGSTNLVLNLNADLLDGFDQSYFLNIGQTSNFITTLDNGEGINITGSGVGRTINVNYDSANLRITGSNQLNTIQDIGTTASPTFASLGLGATSSDYLLNVLGNGYFSTALTVGTSLSVGTDFIVGGTFISVGSTNLVTNLNADLLDGHDESYFLNIGDTGNFITALTGGSGVSITGTGIGRTISTEITNGLGYFTNAIG
ncbi:MAG TPA: hypothetical protein VN174_02670, partial [Candidatus Methanoperedens sp.]|nr:hypothetical protein [Candidatus Methanoperedens sp.]